MMPQKSPCATDAGKRPAKSRKLNDDKYPAIISSSLKQLFTKEN